MTEDWTEEIFLESSNVRSARYHLTSNVLEVSFSNGSTYHYRGVPPHIFEQLTLAPSPGRYHSHAVKNAFPFDQIA